MSKVVLYGAGRAAYVAHRFLLADTQHEVVGFTVDGKYLNSATYRGLPLVAFEDVERTFRVQANVAEQVVLKLKTPWRDGLAGRTW